MFSKIEKISVKLSSLCNLDCNYCHQLSNEKNQNLKFDKFTKLISFLKKIKLADIVDVTLTGGEITIQPKLYEQAVKWFQKLERIEDVKFKFSIVSNGTNINQILEWIEKGILDSERITISWDGLYSASKSRIPKDKTFTDSFFKDEIKKIGQSKYNKDIYVAHAISPDTIKYLYDSFKFCTDNNVKNIGFYYIHEANYKNPEFVKLFEKNVRQISELFIEKYDNLEERFKYFNWQILNAKRFLAQSFCNVIASTKCQKLGRTLHFDEVGNIYGCIYFGDHKALKLGTLDSEVLDKRQLEKFITQYSEIPNCNIEFCNNLHCFECPASNYVHNGHMMHRFSNLCELLTIERNIFNSNIIRINKTELDEKYFWFESEIFGIKDYDKKNFSMNSINVPVSDNNEIVDDNISLSNSYERVTQWVNDSRNI